MEITGFTIQRASIVCGFSMNNKIFEILEGKCQNYRTNMHITRLESIILVAEVTCEVMNQSMKKIIMAKLLQSCETFSLFYVLPSSSYVLYICIILWHLEQVLHQGGPETKGWALW